MSILEVFVTEDTSLFLATFELLTTESMHADILECVVGADSSSRFPFRARTSCTDRRNQSMSRKAASRSYCWLG